MAYSTEYQRTSKFSLIRWVSSVLCQGFRQSDQALAFFESMIRKQEVQGEEEKSNEGLKSWHWTEEPQAEFYHLKYLLSTANVLAFVDNTKPFVVHTDASTDCLGAILYQEVENQQKTVAYSIRGLSSPEKKYHDHKQEFLALKWAATEKFHDYLLGSIFSIYTDNNPLTYVMTYAKLDVMRQRWATQLAKCDFQLHYRSGKTNVDEDLLSRLKIPDEGNIQVISQVVEATLSSTQQDIPCYSVLL